MVTTAVTKQIRSVEVQSDIVRKLYQQLKKRPIPFQSFTHTFVKKGKLSLLDNKLLYPAYAEVSFSSNLFPFIEAKGNLLRASCLALEINEFTKVNCCVLNRTENFGTLKIKEAQLKQEDKR